MPNSKLAVAFVLAVGASSMACAVGSTDAAETTRQTSSAALTGAPQYLGFNPRGRSGGLTYYEFYFGMPAGVTCPSKSGAAYRVYLGAEFPADDATNRSGAVVYPDYTGPSGYSPNVCQVNVAGASGKFVLDFAYDDGAGGEIPFSQSAGVFDFGG